MIEYQLEDATVEETVATHLLSSSVGRSRRCERGLSFLDFLVAASVPLTSEGMSLLFRKMVVQSNT